jgi:amino acid adenylation domain-containing protein
MSSLLHELLIESARTSPERTAIQTSDVSVTYGELVQRAGKVVSQIQRCGSRPGDRIGLLADKCVECYIGLYAILMSGCAYVPLDRRAPADRLAYIIDDCEIKLLVCTRKGLQALTSTSDGIASVEAILLLDADSPDSFAGREVIGATEIASSDPDTSQHIVDTDLAYILYTSGSTGQPKGVMISHAVSMSFVRWAAHQAGVTAHDRISGHAPLHFDLSIFDIFATAKEAATLLPVPDGASTFPSRLTDWMIDKEITIWYSVPSILSMMAKQSGFDARSFPALRVLLFAGEVFPAKYLRMWVAQCPDTTFMNWYGPTETNVITSYTVNTPAGEIDKPVPIGKATANAALFLADDDGNVLEGKGVVGELFARGPCVALGYWGDDSKTREKFSSNTRQPWLRDRVYRTGDRVSVDDDGNYIYQGRADHQVKCRGYRIELGEIEAALYKDKSIQEAAVVPVPDDTIGNRLVAFVSSASFTRAVPVEVIDNVMKFLPQYMLPDRFEVLEQLPKTSNGKVDRQLLSRYAEQLK